MLDNGLASLSDNGLLSLPSKLVVTPILCLLATSTAFQAFSFDYNPSLSFESNIFEVKSLISNYSLQFCSTGGVMSKNDIAPYV